MAPSSIPESSSLDIDACVPLTCTRGCGMDTVDENDWEDGDCEDEASGLWRLSSASTPDISTKEKGEYELARISGLLPFPSP